MQKMTTTSGVPKGLKTVLEARGFDVTGLKTKYSPLCPFESTGCCMARLLSQQDDFINQVSMLEKVITDTGHLCIFLPKFHCELNPIEMVCIHLLRDCGLITIPAFQYWGWCKFHYREVSKPNFAAAKQAAAEILDFCPVKVICHFINRSFRFMSAYCLGLSGKAMEWAVRKQRQHRSVSQRAMMAIEAVLV